MNYMVKDVRKINPILEFFAINFLLIKLEEKLDKQFLLFFLGELPFFNAEDA